MDIDPVTVTPARALLKDNPDATAIRADARWPDKILDGYTSRIRKQMNSAERSQIRQVLHGRRQAIADSWYEAVARTSYAPIERAQAREQFVALTEQVITLLLTEPSEHGRVEAIGASLASLQYVRSETLARTQEVLVQQLVEGLPADQVIALLPRLTALLGGLAAGFFEQARETILSEQERIRAALTSELRQVQGALQKSRDEPEQRVEERTAELTAANEQLDREITERKRAEEALAKEHDLLRTVIDNAPDLIYAKDTEGRFVIGNVAVTRLMGATRPDELLGKTDFDFYPQELAAGYYADEQEIMRLGQPLVSREEPLTDQVTGRKGWLSTTKVPLRDSRGEIVGIVGIGHDITRYKRAEEEAQRRAAQAALTYEVGQRVSSKLGLGELLSEIVTAMRDAFDYYGVMILLVDEEAERLTLQSIAGAYASIFPNDLWLAIGEGMIGYSAANGETQVSGDVSKDPHYVRKANEETKSELSVPIKSGQKVIGVLDLQSNKFGAFDEADVIVMETLADQIAIAIENAQLYEEIEGRRVYLEGVLRGAPDAIVTLNDRFQVVEWNAGAERLFGYSREEAIGQHLDDLVTNPDVYEEATRFTQRALGGKALPPTETVRYRKDGSPVDVILAGSPILVGDELIGVVAVYTDITDRVRMEETLRALALLDDLTGLYNRRGFSILAEQQLKTANRTKRRMVLLFADLDGLKRINDTFGHSEGDQALIETANVLRETFRESDIIARIGGDEFVVLAIETNGLPAEILTTRLQENLAARNAREVRRYKLSLSVGLARYDPDRPCSLDELLDQADRAMYERKQGDDCVQGSVGDLRLTSSGVRPGLRPSPERI